MKADIHPTAYEAKVTCASCGKTWVTLSTKKELRIDVCSNCHPFFTGESARLIDIEGQVDRFYKKLSARQTYVEQQKAKEETANSPERSVDDLELTPRATDALKKVGILNIGQLLAKLGEGNAAVLEISGFGQSSLTAAKKKLRALGFEVPEVPDAPKPPKAPKTAEASEPSAEAGAAE
ncbi:MAG TPA: 50S ribosomal protein L31 [Anaerolineales bacterium]|nr:50S ribosomal protein L31 [Anaerolineales bacterium]HMX19403.1 50S ribosomal protein L31 [Anaerolineales bacterium]HMX73745.1 50S ribosomal protein L31 [Anaerolineales bacterium]HMZ42342.1 50S ribosomal protein L31 [Anaerolineales bacterium]HNA53413.1 50S ribosomal protein L31 [Anaerolineales bacterium]